MKACKKAINVLSATLNDADRFFVTDRISELTSLLDKQLEVFENNLDFLQELVLSKHAQGEMDSNISEWTQLVDEITETLVVEYDSGQVHLNSLHAGMERLCHALVELDKRLEHFSGGNFP